jgi:tetratricopeptide (TPR) repeat protein
MKENKRQDAAAASRARQDEVQRSDPLWVRISKSPLLLLIIPIALVVVIYSNTLNVAFQFDDILNIRDNHYIRITSITPKALWDAGVKSIAFHRPVANISFALNYYVHEFNLAGYHIINIAIHILAGIFLFFLFRHTIDLIRQKNLSPLVGKSANPTAIAFAAALIWLVHPLNTQAVTYIVQRMTSMASMFYILSMLCYVKGRIEQKNAVRWVFFGLGLISGVLAIGSKEIAVTLPFFILLYEWYFFRGMEAAWLKRHPVILSGIAVAGIIVIVVFLDGRPWHRIMEDYSTRDFTMGQRVLTEFRIVIMYLSLVLFPNPGRLNLDYDVPISVSLLNPPTTLLSFLVIACLMIFAVWVAKRDKLSSFVILWFFGNLVIESSVIALELVYEHRNYLPSTFVILLVVTAVYHLVKQRSFRIAVLFLLVTLFSLWTYQRNLVWKDNLVLWQDCLKKSPMKPRTHTNYGLALMEKGMVDQAIPEFTRAIELGPNIPGLYNNLGDALLKKGDIGGCIKQYSIAVQMLPDNTQFLLNLGTALEKTGNIAGSVRYYSRALAIEPDNVDALNTLVKALAVQGNFDGAVELLNKRVKRDPQNEEIYYNSIGNIKLFEKKPDDAKVYYFLAIKKRPDYVEPYLNLGSILMLEGKTKEAEEHFSKAAMVSKDKGKTFMGIASLYIQQGDHYQKQGASNEALQMYEKAYAFQRQSPQVLNKLARAYSSQGNYSKGLQCLTELKEIIPDDPEVYYNLACLNSRIGKIDEAVNNMQDAVKKGFQNWNLLKNDPDLANIRNTEEYNKLIQGR